MIHDTDFLSLPYPRKVKIGNYYHCFNCKIVAFWKFLLCRHGYAINAINNKKI